MLGGWFAGFLNHQQYPAVKHLWAWKRKHRKHRKQMNWYNQQPIDILRWEKRYHHVSFLKEVIWYRGSLWCTKQPHVYKCFLEIPPTSCLGQEMPSMKIDSWKTTSLLRWPIFRGWEVPNVWFILKKCWPNMPYCTWIIYIYVYIYIYANIYIYIYEGYVVKSGYTFTRGLSKVVVSKTIYSVNINSHTYGHLRVLQITTRQKNTRYIYICISRNQIT